MDKHHIVPRDNGPEPNSAKAIDELLLGKWIDRTELEIWRESIQERLKPGCQLRW